MNTTFDNVTHLHCIGIGGIGLSAIARMFLMRGVAVSGSDIAPSLVTGELEKLGAVISFGQSESSIPSETDLVLYTIAIPEDNPELIDAKERGVVLMTYPEALGLISRSHRTVAVAGTHGKTTTTAMIAEMLKDTGFDPSVVVGSFLKESASNFISGESDLFVVEACEYRESFSHLSPDILVITNIEADHLDYYKDLEEIIAAFNRVVRKVPRDGYIVADRTDPTVYRALEGAQAAVVDYDVFVDNIELSVPGEHNRKNGAAALAVGGVLGGDEEALRASLMQFEGTWRRFEKKGETKEGALVYDDYAHHPTELRATLSGARELFGEKSIIAVFQPHLYSRTKLLLSEFAASFGDADKVFVLPIYKAREKDDGTISSEMLVQEMEQHRDNVLLVESFDDVVKELEGLDENSVILTLGAGDVYKVADALIKGGV